MQEFKLSRTEQGDVLEVALKGPALLRFPLLNKGMGFTPAERLRLDLEGVIPARCNDIETQALRSYRTIMFNPDPVGRHIGLAALQDRNEHLYYKVLSMHLEELMPIVYTPTVGKASEHFSRVFRRARGIWITPEHRGRIADVLRKGAPYEGVELMVVTDNESILGIGDQGAGGMAISVGKLALYCAGAGIHPSKTLPISLDVGTNNQALLDDPWYLGCAQKRLHGDEYDALVKEFVAAAKEVFPGVLIQWEDFRKENALGILDLYRQEVTSFNDDIQGTGAVAAACLIAASRIAGTSIKDSRVLIYGAGAAGLGITRQIKVILQAEGLDADELIRSVLVMDSRGVLSDGRESIDEYKLELAWPESMVGELGLEDGKTRDLESIVSAYKPNVLVGASGQANAFDKNVVRAMAAHVERPVILPMSNPTSICEGTPQDILDCTDGKALVATGSPFADVQINGETRRIGQANNVFIFPGLGLGAIVSGASEITNSMINASSLALANSLTRQELAEGCLMPEVSRLWEVCGIVGLAVAQQAIEDGVASIAKDADLDDLLAEYRWQPRYPEFVAGSEAT
jgi:malate dehydrogenase (oxaloacetate-decarboxylating)